MDFNWLQANGFMVIKKAKISTTKIGVQNEYLPGAVDKFTPRSTIMDAKLDRQRRQERLERAEQLLQQREAWRQEAEREAEQEQAGYMSDYTELSREDSLDSLHSLTENHDRNRNLSNTRMTRQASSGVDRRSIWSYDSEDRHHLISPDLVRIKERIGQAEDSDDQTTPRSERYYSKQSKLKLLRVQMRVKENPERGSDRFEDQSNPNSQRGKPEEDYYHEPPPPLPDGFQEGLETDSFDDEAMTSYPQRMNPEQLLQQRLGRLVTFYRNGDPHFKGLQTSVSAKLFTTFETLLVWLNEKIPTTAGVRYVFGLPDAREITDILDFQPGRSYVASSTRKIIRVSYGASRERFWSNRVPSASKVRKGEQELFVGDKKTSKSYPGSRASSHQSTFANGLVSPSGVRPRVLSIVSNTDRNSQQKVILNPQTTQNYEEMLADITNMLKMEFPPVKALYTLKPPHRRVQSFSHLLRGLKNHNDFIACGREEVPLEVSQAVPQGPPPAHKPKAVKARKPTKAFQPAEDLPRDSPRRHHPPAISPFPSQPSLKVPRTPERGKPSPSPKPDLHTPEEKGDHSKGVYMNEHPSLLSITLPPTPEKGKFSPFPSEEQWGHPHISLTPPEVQGEHGQLSPRCPEEHRNHSQLSVSVHEEAEVGSQEMNGHHEDPAARARPQTRSDSLTPEPEKLSVVMPRQPPPAQKPYRKAPQEVESVRVHIHGNLREFHVPRYGQVEQDGNKPDQRLKLDWVYGYRGRDARNNLHVLPSGELMYYVAAIAVVYDRRRDKQVHYLGHTEDITCMAIHPVSNDPLVATGQLAGRSHDSAVRAHIRVWDPRSLQTMAVIGLGVFQVGVSSVGFSAETGTFEPGSLLVAVDDGDKHTLSVWDWQNDVTVAKTTTSADTVVWGCFHPKDYSSLITFGKQHIFFWKLFWDPKKDSSGRILRDKNSGIFEVEEVPKFVTSLTFSMNGDVITGDSNGRITVWSKDNSDAYVINRRNSDHLRHAHNKSIFSLCMLGDGTLLSGGGNEIKAWDTMNNFKAVKNRIIPEGAGYIRTLVPQNFGGADGILYVGTTNNIIFEGSLQDKFATVVQGHWIPYSSIDLSLDKAETSFVTAGQDKMVIKRSFDKHQVLWATEIECHHDELWAIATHPSDNTFITAGNDCYVYKWDAGQRRLLWASCVEKPCLSVAVDPRGLLVVAGTTVGRFVVLNAASGQHMSSIQAGTNQIDVLRFSPDGRLLALGSHDGSILVYEVLDEGQVFRKYKSGTLKGHDNFVTHLDWSKDSKYVQTVSGDYDLLFWDVDEMKELRSQYTRDIEWHTETCILGYNTLGAWSNLREGEDINTVCRSGRGDQFAVGDNQGALRLYRYPCTAERAEFHEVKKYSGHVTNVKFTPGDDYLITTGGIDAGVLQWTLVNNTGYT